MSLELSQPAAVGRVAAFADDGLTMFVEMAVGGVATATSDEGFSFDVGDVLLVRAEDNHLELAPGVVWSSSKADDDQRLWVGQSSCASMTSR